MKGWPAVRLVDAMSNAITEELRRLDADYRQRRWADLNAEVRDHLLRGLRRDFPTIFSAYRRELAERGRAAGARLLPRPDQEVSA